MKITKDFEIFDEKFKALSKTALDRMASVPVKPKAIEPRRQVKKVQRAAGTHVLDFKGVIWKMKTKTNIAALSSHRAGQFTCNCVRRNGD